MSWLLQDDSARSVGGAGDTVSAEVEHIYGALLHGPKKQAPTEGMRLPLRTPQGTKALSEAIHALLEGHVEYIHQAHHHLLPVELSKLPFPISWYIGSFMGLARRPLKPQQGLENDSPCMQYI